MESPYTLYVLTGSRHSEEAQKLLEESGLPFKVENDSSSTALARLFYDIGIGELPTLTGNQQRYEGLNEIKEFIEMRAA